MTQKHGSSENTGMRPDLKLVPPGEKSEKSPQQSRPEPQVSRDLPAELLLEVLESEGVSLDNALKPFDRRAPQKK